MKTPSAKGKISGFTLVELLVVIVIIAVLAAMLLPESGGPKSAYRVMCMNNEKQIALGVLRFQSDNSGRYPWQDSATNGGLIEFFPNKQVFTYFRGLSPDLGKQTRIFVCPYDKERHEAVDFTQLLDTNISYFLNLDVATSSASVLTGDRNLEADGKAVNHGPFIYSTNIVLNWTRELHGKSKNGPMGVLSFADGHVQVAKGKNLDGIFKQQGMTTARLEVP